MVLHWRRLHKVRTSKGSSRNRRHNPKSRVSRFCGQSRPEFDSKKRHTSVASVVAAGRCGGWAILALTYLPLWSGF